MKNGRLSRKIGLHSGAALAVLGIFLGGCGGSGLGGGGPLGGVLNQVLGGAASPITSFLGGSGAGGLTGGSGIPGLQVPGLTGPPPGAGYTPLGGGGGAHGVPITGNGATGQNLAEVKRGLQYFQPRHLAGLSEIRLVHHNRPKGAFNGGTGDTSGMWHGSYIVLNSYQGQPIKAHSLVHEVAHHVTLRSRASQFGTPFLQALQSGGNPVATSYAQQNHKELMAENVSVMLLGAGGLKWRVLPGYRPTEQAKALCRQEFGRLAI